MTPRARRAAPRLPASIEAERRHVMRALHPVVRMLGTIVGQHVEVVLHDLTRPEASVVEIVNGHVSGRRIGASILSGPKEDQGFAQALRMLTRSGEAVHSVIDGYPTLTRSAHRLKSSTVVFRDASGEPFAALCVNADYTTIEAAHALLGHLLHPAAVTPAPDEDQPEMDALMKEIITDAVRRAGRPVGLMSREERILAVQAMMQRGLFIVKGGVERAAAALGVTRFTIYNYLEALRAREAALSADRTAPPVARSRRR